MKIYVIIIKIRITMDRVISLSCIDPSANITGPNPKNPTSRYKHIKINSVNM